MHALIFRCAWKKKSIHTICSCLFTSPSNVMRCGKTLSHWFFKQSNNIYGGVPLHLEDIKTEPDLVKNNFDLLFVHRTQITHKTKFNRMIAATVLKFHEAFLGIIGNEPSGKYKYPTHHHFLQKSFPFFHEHKFQWRPFTNGKMKSLQVLAKDNWLTIDV